MSLFQCSSCGCVENTSLTGGYWNLFLEGEEQNPNGVREGKPFGAYCSVCNPVWFTKDGSYGYGPRTSDCNDEEGYNGKWHNRFSRTFLPKGMFHTNEDGNLAHVETLDTDFRRYALPEEDEPGKHVYIDRNLRLPCPGTKESAIYLKKIKEFMDNNKRGDGKSCLDVVSIAAAIAAASSVESTGFASPKILQSLKVELTPEEELAVAKAHEERIAKAERKRERRRERLK